MTVIEILKELKKPMPYKWRVQSRNKEKTKAMCTAYVDARDVMDRLDEVCPGWSDSYQQLDGFIFCTISIPAADGIVSRTDCGKRVEENEQDQMYDEAGKAAASDAFKRAAVKLGVARFIYDIPMKTLPCDQYGNVVDDRGQRVWDLTKHINGLGDGVKHEPAPKPAAPAQQAVEAAKKKLDQQTTDAMIKAIADGRWADVEAALPKYSLTLSQKTVLTKLLNDAKQKNQADANR